MSPASTAPERSAPLPEQVAVDQAAAWMTQLLRAGLAVALAFIAGALAVLVARDPSGDATRATAARVIEGYLGVSGVAVGLVRGLPEAYITLGVLVLLATPVIRVLTGLYFFRRARDRPLTWIAAAVLGMLLASVFVIGPLVR